MRVLHLQQRCVCKTQSFCKNLIVKSLKRQRLPIFLLLIFSSTLNWANGPSENSGADDFSFTLNSACSACDNVVIGGLVQSDEFGCPSPTWDPSPITNVALPTGGTGTLQYLWIYTTGDPTSPLSQWTPIPGSNAPDYDPGPISVTTYFRRCARRSGCTEYVGESNIVVKEAICCDNVTDGGQIGSNQVGCTAPFDPAALVNLVLPTGGSNTLEYQWVVSTTGNTYMPGSPDWAPIANATQAGYDPGPVSQTTYFIRLSRRHGCLDFNGVSNMVTITISTPVSAGAVATAVTCFGGNNGSIDLTVSGGLAPYQYAWTPSLGNVQDPQSLAAGNYSVTVTDANGCSGQTSVVVADGIQLSPVVNTTAVSCLGASNGSATVTSAGGGTPGYSYQWSYPPAGNSASINNLPSGSYTVTVTDANGCTGQTGFSINAGISLVPVINLTNESCLGANNGSASVTSVTNGTPGFTYSWSFPFAGNTQTINDLPPNNYTVTVTDAAGCMATASLTIAAGPELQVDVTTTPALCLGGDGGSATVIAVTGGIGGYTYQWNDSSAQTTQTASNLSAGNYTVFVNDTQGCIGTGSASVGDGVALVLNTSHTDATCGSSDDGTATVEVMIGAAPYLYVWNDANAQTTATAFSLAAGTYTVSVTDANGCTATANETVEAPMDAEIQVSATPVSCFGGSNGSVSATVLNDDPANYFYQWNTPGGGTGQQINGVPANTYTVTVTDANGCLVTGSATVSQPPVLALTLVSNNASCANSSDGSAEVFVNGGTPFPGSFYNYNWNAPGNPQVPVLDDVSPGTYTVTVTDANGCTSTGSITIGAPPALNIGLNASDVSCSGLNNGSATANASGGVLPYAYLWDNPSASTTASVSNLGPGVYEVTVTDANGCTATAAATIFEPPVLALTVQKTDVICINGSNGTATAVTSGGVSPYSYLWGGGQTTAQISNLTTGIYNVTVTDANGCFVTGSAQIISTTNLATSASASPATCFNSNNGSAQVNVTGGSAPFTYNWSNGATTAVNSNLPAGQYSVTVTDANGCSVTSSATVTSPPQITCSAQVVSPITTYNGSDGSVSVSASGGAGNFTFNWSNGSTSSTVSNLAAGTYVVTVSDGNGCTCTSSAILKNPSKVGNFVWNDLNGNGIQDAGEPGIEGVNVRLIGATGTGTQVNLLTTTDTNGNYAFDGLSIGTYQVKVEPPTLHVFTQANAGNDDTKDSDINPTDSLTSVFALAQGYFDSNWDAGLVELDEKINIGDFVWMDANHNGIQDLNEQGIAGVPVKLYQSPGNSLVASTTTDQFGKYLFTNVMPGNYFVEFSLSTLPNGYIFAPQDVGANDLIDSDPNPANGRTAVFTVFAFTLDNLSIDAGIFKECDNVTDGGLVGYDENLCGLGADPAEIVNIQFPTGGFGTLEYLWLSSNVPVYNGPGDPNWTPIPNSNSANYNPGPISQSTYYIRCSRRQGCSDYPGESNVVAKTVTANPLTQIIQQPGALCVNEAGDFAAAIAGGGATYFWEFGPTAVPQTASTRVASGVYWTTAGAKTVKLTVTRFGCSSSVTTTIQVSGCTNPIMVIEDLFATLQGQQVELNWKVNGDASNTIFYIQRSENGADFENLSALAGEVGVENSAYHFMDPKPRLGENIYRIKYRRLGTVNEEGFSGTASVFYQPAGMRVATVYPNPTFGKVTIELFEQSESVVEIQICNAFGKVMKTAELPAFSEKLELEMNGYSQGVYWFRIKQNRLREQVLKVVKVD
jgi:hypothetical protein